METNHYPSLELCRQLTDTGWSTETDKSMDKDGNVNSFMHGFSTEDVFCPSVMEMLSILPKSIYSNPLSYTLNIYCDGTDFEVSYSNFYNEDASRFSIVNLIDFYGALPNVLAELILWASQEGHINFNNK